MKFRPATVCAVLSLLATGLTPGAATADVVSATSNGGVTQYSLAPHPRGRNGFYNLDAFAQDSVNGPLGVSSPKGPIAYLRGPGPFADATTATDPGQRFAPTATARISYTAATWDSRGSTVNAVAPGPNPGFRGPEATQARASVRDPFFFDPLPFDDPISFTVVFNAGLEVSALATDGDHAVASIFSDASTDFSGLGELWSLNWFADGSTPGSTAVDFSSNPALGLDDDAITSAFIAHISSDPRTGRNWLDQDVSFTFSLLIPANQTPEFSGSMVYAAAAAVPVPNTLNLFGAGPLCLLACRWRRWKR